MKRPTLSFSTASFVTLAALAGCSVLNAPDDLQPPMTGDGDGDSNSGGGEGDGDGGGSSGGSASTGGSDMGGSDGSGGGGTEPVPEPAKGLLVVAGDKSDMSGRVLSVLAAEDGTELVREDLQVAALGYDGAPMRDVFFIFTASQFPADPARKADLAVRRFNDTTDEWVDLGDVSSLPPPRPGTVVVLNDRLAYLSYEVVDNNPVQALTILDTTDLSNITQIQTTTAPALEEYIGLQGTRGSETNEEALGGTLNLMVKENCTKGIPEICSLNVQRIFVGPTIDNGVEAPVGKYIGQPAFASARDQATTYVALNNAVTAMERVSIWRVAPHAPDTPMESVTTSEAETIGGLGLAECSGAVVFSETTEQSLFGANLTAGLGTQFDLGADGAQVYFEPFTEDIISFHPPQEVMDADPTTGIRRFEADAQGVSITINEYAGDWNAPADYTPLTAAIRFPLPFKCE